MRLVHLLPALALAPLLALACSAASDPSPGDPGGTGGSGATGPGPGPGVGGSIGTGQAPTAIGHLQGKVFAPEGTIPISGALLYLVPTPPPAIPDGVFCDRCVELDVTVPNTLSGPDGSFELPAYVTGDQYLVVQKGQFRRVRQVSVVEGTQPVDAALTTLPGAMDEANGDEIPRMAVVDGAWDQIENTLEKLGMQPGSFTMFGFDYQDLLDDPARMNQFHIVFMPCSWSSGTDCNSSPATSGTVQQNLRQFVDQGGKLYVTDYSYDFVRQTWPEYVDWMYQTSEFGSACLSYSYDAPAVVDDQGMRDWLEAQGIVNFSVEANWTMVDKVNTVSTTDVDGNPAMVTPKVWVTAQTSSEGPRPATVSFERGCGRVLFSTYHTEGTGGTELLPQEKALLYVLLEVAVCVGTPIVE